MKPKSDGRGRRRPAPRRATSGVGSAGERHHDHEREADEEELGAELEPVRRTASRGSRCPSGRSGGSTRPRRAGTAPARARRARARSSRATSRCRSGRQPTRARSGRRSARRASRTPSSTSCETTNSIRKKRSYRSARSIVSCGRSPSSPDRRPDRGRPGPWLPQSDQAAAAQTAGELRARQALGAGQTAASGGLRRGSGSAWGGDGAPAARVGYTSVTHEPVRVSPARGSGSQDRAQVPQAGRHPAGRERREPAEEARRRAARR